MHNRILLFSRYKTEKLYWMNNFEVLRLYTCFHSIILLEYQICVSTHHHHHHWQNSPFWAISFLRRFCQIASGFDLFEFRNNNFFTEQGRQPCVQPPTWRTRSLYLGPPRNRVAQSYLQAPGSLFVAFYDLQGYGGYTSILTRLQTGILRLIFGNINLYDQPLHIIFTSSDSKFKIWSITTVRLSQINPSVL
jgi:hypothetical protein